MELLCRISLKGRLEKIHSYKSDLKKKKKIVIFTNQFVNLEVKYGRILQTEM